MASSRDNKVGSGLPRTSSGDFLFFGDLFQPIPVAPDCSISIMAVGQVTQGAIETLVKHLELFKRSFPKTVPADSQDD